MCVGCLCVGTVRCTAVVQDGNQETRHHAKAMVAILLDAVRVRELKHDFETHLLTVAAD